ncbi:PAS domain S-box protein [Sphingomonas sp. LHG3406-1]|uniref:PAS domain-containing hybrid sensor histidine kinase/response regulator n=1 Tax=Sphingomonas sp. LHG3406-1 TaxID=2804617 RepID=UPI0026232AD6|nr:PAS domain S-box protein [Sphingomonas sp. LHG3406-1]
MNHFQPFPSMPPSRATIDDISSADSLSHLIAETTSDAFVAINCDNRIVYWNSGAERMLGWSAAEAIGESLHIIIPPDHRQAHSRGMARLCAGAEPKLVGNTTEIAALTKEGGTLPVELSLTMWTEPANGKPAGFAAIMRDISQRRALEEERNAYARRLEEQFAAIEAASDGIATTDEAGYFQFMNRAHALMFGYERASDAVGVHWTELYDPAEARRIEEEAVPQIAAQGSWRGEASGRHLNGSAIEQEVTLSAGANGGLICITRDISERQRVMRERIRTREQLLLAERQETIGRVMSGMVHDFNNLMAVISASAAALEQDGGAEPAQVARIHNAASAASKLLHKIMKPERRTADVQVIDLSRIVREVAELIEVSLAPGHGITVEAPDQEISIQADESELMQVLMNLCTNARDALAPDLPGHIALTVEATHSSRLLGTPAIGHKPSGPVALVRVEDNGCGIAREDLERIFEPFVTRKKALGTGLGLAVVAKLVSEAGGAIFVATGEGGTCFELTWPLDGAEREPLDQHAVPERVDLSGRTILSVDDNPALLDLIALHLERVGAEVCPCPSPAEGLAVLRDSSTHWDAIVVDYDMPEMNGVEFAAMARQIRPEVPIILCSAVAEDLVIPPTSRALFAAIRSKSNLHLHLPATVSSAISPASASDTNP